CPFDRRARQAIRRKRRSERGSTWLTVSERIQTIKGNGGPGRTVPAPDARLTSRGLPARLFEGHDRARGPVARLAMRGPCLHEGAAFFERVGAPVGLLGFVADDMRQRR